MPGDAVPTLVTARPVPSPGETRTSISLIDGGYSLLFSSPVYFLKLPGKKRNDGADKHPNKQTTALWMEPRSDG